MKKVLVYILVVLSTDLYSQIEPFVGVGITSYNTKYQYDDLFLPTSSANVVGGLVFKDLVVSRLSFTKSAADGLDIWNNYGITNATNKSFSVVPILLRQKKIKGGFGLVYLRTKWTFNSESRIYSNKQDIIGLSFFIDYRLNEKFALIAHSCLYNWDVSYSNDIGISYRIGEIYRGSRKNKIISY
jgi:hypothetical protein